MGHLFKKLTVWTLCLAMAVGMLPGLARGAMADEPDAGASTGIAWNEEKGYYEISSYEGLLEFARIVNGTPAQFQNDSAANAKIVVKEIDASTSNPKNLGYDAQTTAWTPIGNYSSPYTGKFDGNGCTIRGLTIESKNDYIGLFGYVGEGGCVQNVNLEGGSIKGNNNVGGVTGRNNGTVSNCSNTGAVSGNNIVGGVTGSNSGTVSNCSNTGDVSGNNNVGGVTGLNPSGIVSNCSNTGDVSGSNHVGGTVGTNGGTVSHCLNTGDVKESRDFVGGVVGDNYSGTVSHCFNTGMVDGEDYYVGGVVGKSFEGTVSNCYNTGDVTGSGKGERVGGVVGDIFLSTVMYCYNTGAVSGGTDLVGGVAGDITRGTVSNCYYDRNVCVIKGAADANNWKAIGEGSGTNVTGLTTAEMTGENAVIYLKPLTDAVDDNGEKIWITQDNTFDTYYYPHLAGFEYSKTNNLKDWPAAIRFTFELSPASLVYNGKTQAPTVTVKKDGVAVDSHPYSFKYGESINAGGYSITVTNKDSGKTEELAYEIEKRQIEITVPNQTFLYNGLNHGTADAQYKDDEIEGVVSISDTDGLASTDSLSLITIACQPKTDAGTYKGVLAPKDAQIVNIATGKDMTVNYDIKYVPGNLIITPMTVKLTANSGETTTYDGTEKTVSGYKCSVEGLTFDGISAEISATKPGTYEVAFSNVTLNQTTDSTGNYVVSETTNGTLTINKRPLTITADSDTKVYDGTALSNDSVSAEGLADGDKIESIIVTGSQTMTGKSDNVPKNAKIVNAKGEDVTDCYEITYKNGTLTVTKPDSPALDDDQKPAPKKDLKEDGKEQILVLDPANLPEGYTIEYSTDGGKTWKAAPTGTQSGEYTIEVFYKADENHTDFFGDTLSVIIQGVYNQTDSDGDWTKGSGKTYTFRIKKAFNDEATYDNLTGVFVDGKKAEPGKDYTPAKGSAIITFAADYLETLSVGEHMIRVVFKDGEILMPLKILEAVATPTPAVDATPVTGDTANPFLFVALILVSMAGVAVMIEKKRGRA
ncbi:MAG: hypothetical protein K6F26_00515 [Lachnospiraceae bacterium]|nr:hypothetical protein [Lachnospiraceae bacterium]